MSSSSGDVLEKDAAVQRELLAADIRELRQRMRPARIASDLQESAKIAAAPMVAKLNAAAKSHPLGVTLIAAVAGAVAAQLPGSAGPTRKRFSRERTLYQTPGNNLSGGATATMIGIGAVLGMSLARGIGFSEQGRRLIDAVVDDVQGVFVKTSMKRVNDVVNGDSKYANAMKLALAGIAVLTQRE